MNKIVCTLITASFLTAGIAAAQNNNSNSKTAKAHEITDSQMGNITAGQTDTSIAAAGSTVTTTNSATGSLAGSSLSSASGVNITTAVNSSVANGVNIYAATLSADHGNDGSKVSQDNTIGQSDPDSNASLSKYSNGPDLTVNNTYSNTSNTTNASTLSNVSSFNHSTTDSSAFMNTGSHSQSAAESSSDNHAFGANGELQLRRLNLHV